MIAGACLVWAGLWYLSESECVYSKSKKETKSCKHKPSLSFHRTCFDKTPGNAAAVRGFFQSGENKSHPFPSRVSQCSDPESDLAKNEKKDIKRGDLFGSAESTPEVLRDSFPISHCSLELLLRISSGIERLIYLDSLRRLVRDGNFASWT